MKKVSKKSYYDPKDNADKECYLCIRHQNCIEFLRNAKEAAIDSDPFQRGYARAMTRCLAINCKKYQEI